MEKLSGLEPKLIKLEFIIYLPKLKVCPFGTSFLIFSLKFLFKIEFAIDKCLWDFIFGFFFQISFKISFLLANIQPARGIPSP